MSSSWSLGQSRFTIGTGNPWSPLRSSPSTVISSRAQLTFQACAPGRRAAGHLELQKSWDFKGEQPTPEYWIRLKIYASIVSANWMPYWQYFVLGWVWSLKNSDSAFDCFLMVFAASAILKLEITWILLEPGKLFQKKCWNLGSWLRC